MSGQAPGPARDGRHAVLRHCMREPWRLRKERRKELPCTTRRPSPRLSALSANGALKMQSNKQMEGLHVNADTLADADEYVAGRIDSDDLVARARARYGLG